MSFYKIFITIFSVLLFAGCASTYQPNIHTYNMLTGQEIAKGAVKASPVPTLTTFEQWPSMWSAVCGTIVMDNKGNIVGNMAGACGTPLTLFMNSTVNLGLASSGAALIH